MTHQLDQFVAGEVGGELGHVAQDGAHSEQRGRPVQVLQVPVEEGEDEAVAETHEPGNEQHGAVTHAAKKPQQLHVAKLLTSGGRRAICPARGFLLGPASCLFLRMAVKVELRGDDQRHCHEHTKDNESDLVVLVFGRSAASRTSHGVGDMGVVDPDSHKEHGQPPTQRTPHPLQAVAVTVCTQVLQGHLGGEIMDLLYKQCVH